MKALFIIMCICFSVAIAFAQDTEIKHPEPPEGMVYVPAGGFIMGSVYGDPDERPRHISSTGAFFIDKYEVSNAEFAKFDPDFKFPEGWEERAAIVNWYQADAYAKWAGKRLPTEKEWEKAARGTDGRIFPWGNTYDNTYVVWDRSTSRGGSIAKPASPYGCYDMAGSVWEWTSDWYQPYPGNDVPMEQYGEKYKVMRGGSNFNNQSFITTSHRYYVDPVDIRAYPVGIRCVKDIEAGLIKKTEKKPNIIYIYTDQQRAGMMSCAGNKWLKTPAMDYIAENGIRFTKAYTTNPVCSPSRVSLMTGRFPGYFNDAHGNQVRENMGAVQIPSVSEEVRNTTIAAFLKEADYELIYGGKEHLPESLTPTALGFKDICDDERAELAKKAAEVIKAEHDKPYFMVVSLINPHDICYMAIREFADTKSARSLLKRGKVELAVLDSAMKRPAGITDEQFFKSYCPPLPVNYEPQVEEPEAVKSLIERRPFRKNARDNFTDEQWRLHRWAYCRLTELVDKRVQVILNALKESGQEENTLVIFSSDHGDMDASHRMEHKTALYEEAVNIPFMVMWKGHIPEGQVDDKHLVSNGLDLLPTVCDYAGIKGVSDQRGRTLRPLLEGKDIKWRKTLGVESEIGRMVVDEEGFKYIRYDVAGIEEQLLNLNEDPKETKHFTNDPRYAEKLNSLRRSFDIEWFQHLINN